jgi:hypothetical protein
VGSAVEGARKSGILTRKDDRERQLIRVLAQAQSRFNDLLRFGFVDSRPTALVELEQYEAYEDLRRAEEALKTYRESLRGDTLRQALSH